MALFFVRSCQDGCFFQNAKSIVAVRRRNKVSVTLLQSKKHPEIRRPKHRFWVRRTIFQQREATGTFQSLFQELKNDRQ